jgi:RHS repeat-associated protein
MAAVEPPVAALAEGLDTNLDVITYGDADWALSYVLPYYGGDCTRSGQIDDEEYSEMQITVGGEGTLTFWWRAYSESNDAMSFEIDDVERCDPISGDEHIEWEEKSFNITGEGNHKLEWRYAKNGWAAAGDDCGYVDCLQWTGGGPIPPPEPPEPPEPEWLTVSYTYDAAGRRIQKKVDGVVEVKYVYDGDHVIAEYDGSDTLLRKYVYGPSIDEPICMINATEGYQDTYYYHFDALGSVVALTNSAANAVQFYDYSVWGQVSASDPNHPNRFMFTGREFDKDTGLYYYRARYYNPEIGRFLQTDPIGYGCGMNLYAYCGNNSLCYSDPSGLAWEDPNLRIIFYDGSSMSKDDHTGEPYLDENGEPIYYWARAATDTFWDLRFDISAKEASDHESGSSIDYMLWILAHIRDYAEPELKSRGYTWSQAQIEGVWIGDHGNEIGDDNMNERPDFWASLGRTLDEIKDDAGNAKAKSAWIHSRQCDLADYDG